MKTFDIKTGNESTNTELLKTTQLENTPFSIVELDNKYFGTIQNYRLTELYDNAQEAEQELTNFNWNNFTKVVLVLIEIMKSKDLNELLTNK